MPKLSNFREFRWSNTILILIALLIVIFDQLSKAWIRANLLPGQSILHIGIFRITHVSNTGAAFGLFHGNILPLTIVSIVGTVVILTYVFFLRHRFPISQFGNIALGLLLGGTVGNLIDRIRLGYVTDFIDFQYWPAFNVADSAVVVGSILLASSLLLTTSARKSGS